VLLSDYRIIRHWHEWKDGGEEWSAWGLPRNGSAQFSRLTSLPAPTILEIAPGFGRWTHYLREHCERLHIVDPAEDCIEACRCRFGDDARLSYHVNDGSSLAMIPDRSIDFVFSFDSLVHVTRETVEAYVHQLANKLNEDGAGFIHHSNLGSTLRSWALSGEQEAPIKAKILDQDYRAPDMTAELFRSYCAGSGLTCVCQELVNWRATTHRLFHNVRAPRFQMDGDCRMLRNLISCARRS
jgi:SAM-dependent methyltransferase